MTSREKDSAAASVINVRPASECLWDLVALGEVMLRFDPGEGRIVGARQFHVWEGGAEYNVARGLRRCFRMRTTVVSALVENPVGRLVEDLILQGGVDVSNLRWRPSDGIGREARNGLYFLERGFGVRAGLGVMDRGHTPISQLQPGEIDWDAIFAPPPRGGGARWFHTGGIMAALSESATAVVEEAMRAARRHGTIVSLDCNYRPSLWRARGGRKGAVEVNRSLLPHVDVLFGHEGDLSLDLGESSQGPVWHNLETYAPMAEHLLSEFPHLQVIATTVRNAYTANRNSWSAFCYANGKVFEGLQFPELDILDRVGGGDAFAAGMIYGLLERGDFGWAVNCGVAHGALAMTTAGDASTATFAEVERLMSGTHANTLR